MGQVHTHINFMNYDTLKKTAHWKLQIFLFNSMKLKTQKSKFYDKYTERKIETLESRFSTVFYN